MTSILKLKYFMSFLAFLLDPIIVWMYCFLIFTVFMWRLVPFLREAEKLRVKLCEATEKLNDFEGEKGFSEQFEQYHAYARIKFGRAWEEFVEMLIFPSPGSDDPIRNTSEVSKYLSEATIISPKVPFRILHSVPNLLMGLGILGTFLGLAVGVGTANTGLSSGVPSEITASLEQLLSGASLAFISSIVGIFLSILFLMIERSKSQKLQSELRKWIDGLEKRLRLVTAPSIALDQLEEARLATRQLVSFNTELVFSIEQALEDKVAGRLVPQLERVVESIEGLRSDRTTDAEHIIERSMNQFTEVMKRQTGSQFEEMASIVDNLNNSLKDASHYFAQTQHDLRDTLDSVITNMKTSLDTSTTSISETLHQSVDSVASIVTSASKKMTDEMITTNRVAAEELRTTIDRLIKDLATTSIDAASQITSSLHGLEEASEILGRSTKQSERILESMTSFVGQLNTLRNTISSSHQQMTILSERLECSARDVQISSNRSADTLEQTSEAVERMGALIQALEKNQRSITTTWAQYQDRFEDIDSSLARVFEQIDEGLIRYCKQVDQFASTLDRTAANAIKNLAGAISEFNESIEELIPRLPSSTNKPTW
ncbi:MAG: hypothetical protein OXE92_08835 [Bacteroidetes bacterium]|nr:hypothetical protein [Bacteroidota bacterium]MCY4205813.1 hypothetical protein [Bacteroidota bacterium]